MMDDQFRPNADRPSLYTRRFVIAALPLSLSACVGGGLSPVSRFTDPRMDPLYLSMYGPDPAERFPLPAIDLTKIQPAYFRRQVQFLGETPPGSIVIDPQEKYLYYVQPENLAMRYGIGVGREGFAWSGKAVIRRKSEWPSWHPPVEMQARDPKAAKWASGMPGGLNNPLGARALYLYQGNQDTLYRIHGTNEPWTVGSNVSSGCIRMINQDAIDLFSRVAIGTEVNVLGDGEYV